MINEVVVRLDSDSYGYGTAESMSEGTWKPLDESILHITFRTALEGGGGGLGEAIIVCLSKKDTCMRLFSMSVLPLNHMLGG